MNRSQTISIEKAFKKFENFLSLSLEVVEKNPLVVVLAMHDYFRNLYPVDHFLKQNYSTDSLENIILCLDNCIKSLEAGKDQLLYYNLTDLVNDFGHKSDINTQALYGRLWRDRLENDSLESTETLRQSFESNGFDISYFQGKTVLDMGCGSGRFTLALASFGVKEVVGIDLGDEGLSIAKEMVVKQNLTNVRFEKGSVLDLPFENRTFDFVFCKGVLHHTGDINKGIEELYRVLKIKGKAFIYLYGSGGLFWYSRKKVKKVMQQIPIEYTLKILSLIQMPSKRTIFVDNWYVTIEDFVEPLELEIFLRKIGFKNIDRWKKGKDYHLETSIFNNTPNAKEIWGVGELRYTLEK